MVNEGVNPLEGTVPKNTEQLEVRLEGNSWELESNPRVLEAVRQALAVRFREAGWTEDELGPIPTAIDEAITNAIVHGNLRVPGKRKNGEDELYNRRLSDAIESELGKLKVRLQLNVTPELIFIQVTDEGEGFVPPEPSSVQFVAEQKHEGGYGITIIRGAFDDVQFLRNTVTMIKRRPNL